MRTTLPDGAHSLALRAKPQFPSDLHFHYPFPNLGHKSLCPGGARDTSQQHGKRGQSLWDSVVILKRFLGSQGKNAEKCKWLGRILFHIVKA
jgi:hypothetical protein